MTFQQPTIPGVVVWTPPENGPPSHSPWMAGDNSFVIILLLVLVWKAK